MIVTVKPRRTAILGVLPKNKPINGEMTVDLNPREINYCLSVADVFDENGNPISEKIPENYKRGSETIVKNGYEPSSIKENAFPVKLVQNNEIPNMDEETVNKAIESVKDEIENIMYKNSLSIDSIIKNGETQNVVTSKVECIGDSDLVTITGLKRNEDGSYDAIIKLAECDIEDFYDKDAFIIAINNSKVKPNWEVYKESEKKFVKFASKFDDLVLGEEKIWTIRLTPKTEDKSIDIDFIIKVSGNKVINKTSVKFINLQ